MSSDPVYEVVEYATAAPFKTFITGLRAINRHVHEDFEIGYVISGLGRLSLNAKEITLKTEDLFVVNCNTVHSFESDATTPMVVLFIQLRPSLLEALNIPIRSLEIRCTPKLAESRRGAEALRRLRSCCIALVREITGGATEASSLVPAHLLSILSLLLRQFPCSRREDARQLERGRYYDRICRIIRYLNENFAEEVSLSAVAERMNMSVYHLCHIFKKMVGISVGRYLTSVRLEKVKEQLLTRDDSVTTIAMDCGFSNLGYFYKTFHCTMGCTPLQYKLQKVQGAEAKPAAGATTSAPASAMASAPAAPPPLDAFHSAAIGNYLNVDRDIIDAHLPRRTDQREPDEGAPERSRSRITSVSVDIHGTAERLAISSQRIVTMRGLPTDRSPAWKEALTEVHRGIGFAWVRLEVPGRAESVEGDPTLAKEVASAIREIRRLSAKPLLRLAPPPRTASSAGRTGRGKASSRRGSDRAVGIRRLVSSLAEQLSREETRGWCWELSDGLSGTRSPASPDAFIAWYADASQAIRSVAPSARIGGVVTAPLGDREQPQLRSFLYTCAVGKLPLDFITLRIGPAGGGPAAGGLAALGDPVAIADTLKSAHAAMKVATHARLAVHVDLSPCRHGLPLQPRDHATIPALLIEQLIEAAGLAETFSFASSLNAGPHRGAAGCPESALDLLDANGAYLPAYHGCWFAARMGDACLERGPGFLVTRKGRDRVQVLLWNRAARPPLAAGGNGHGDVPGGGESYLHVEVTGLVGLYKALEYSFDRRHGSLTDRWLDIGSPAVPPPDELEILREGSRLKRMLHPVQYQGRFSKLVSLKPHAVKLIELYPADGGS